MADTQIANPAAANGAPASEIPTEIVIRGAPDMRLTANEMRRIKLETGHTLNELMGDEADEADRMQTIAWLELRRQGHDVRWDDVGDVALEFVTVPEDPTNAGPPSNSPPSAITGE